MRSVGDLHITTEHKYAHCGGSQAYLESPGVEPHIAKPNTTKCSQAGLAGFQSRIRIYGPIPNVGEWLWKKERKEWINCDCLD